LVTEKSSPKDKGTLMDKKIISSLFFFLLLVIVSMVCTAQEQFPPPRMLIDTPTAGTLTRGSYDVTLRLYPQGGVIASVGIGLSSRLLLGLSYGGENVIGEGKVNWNPDPGVQLRYRLIDENIALPAIVLGFDSQGYGAYIDSTKRYTVKSRGFFAVASKNYVFLGDLSLHGGINYSLEKSDGDSDPNLFVGIIKSLNPDLALVAEYDFALNDNEDNALGSGKGYLNTGLRWTFAQQLYIEISLKNILQNKHNIPYSNREIKINYYEHF